MEILALDSERRERMMNILLITYPLFPNCGNNANLLRKLIAPIQREHRVHILSLTFERDHTALPTCVEGVPVHWVTDEKKDFVRELVFPAVSKIVDPDGYSDALQAMLVSRELKQLHTEYSFDAIISAMEPYSAACAALQLPIRVKKFLYLMDPPGCTYDASVVTKYRKRMLRKVLAGYDCVLTTPFIREALREHGYSAFEHKMTTVGFPMVDENACRQREKSMDDGKIHLLFCGWLYSDIRSPKYFLDILSRLDERFCVTFMGKECELLRERFDIETKAEIRMLPQQPYEVALQAMADADILINIGNSVPVHMPSKTLEYINTGKPMVNFHKMTDCPTLYYTQRYPLCLNLYEGDEDVDKAAERFVRFCEENVGQRVDREFIEREYADCTPEYIAQKILDKLGEHND